MNWYKYSELLIKYLPRIGAKIGIYKNPTEAEFKSAIIDDQHGTARVMIMPNMDMYVASATEALHHELIEGLNLQGYRAAVRAEIYKGRILVDGLTWEGAYKLQDEATRNAIFQRYHICRYLKDLWSGIMS